MPNWPTLPELIPDSVARGQLGALLLPLDAMLVHRRLPPSILSWDPFILLGGERHCEIKVSAQEHNTMTLTGAQTWTA